MDCQFRASIARSSSGEQDNLGEQRSLGEEECLGITVLKTPDILPLKNVAEDANGHILFVLSLAIID